MRKPPPRRLALRANPLVTMVSLSAIAFLFNQPGATAAHPSKRSTAKTSATNSAIRTSHTATPATAGSAGSAGSAATPATPTAAPSNPPASIPSNAATPPAGTTITPVSYSKRLRESILSEPMLPPEPGSISSELLLPKLQPPEKSTDRPLTPTVPPQRNSLEMRTSRDDAQHDTKASPYPWRNNIVTTTFWIGEHATKNNPVPNHASSWDTRWAENYGGTDEPNPARRAHYIPVDFTPRQNPFYIALPYNDVTRTGHKPEAANVVPWFQKDYEGPSKSVLKGRWIAIRRGDRICYAQWEDCGPFRTDHWQYVFGNERPKPNLNRGAGLDVSPAVRDFLGMADTDVTDWRFVEFEDVPRGPWSLHGDNNSFVLLDRGKSDTSLVKSEARPR